MSASNWNKAHIARTAFRERLLTYLLHEAFDVQKHGRQPRSFFEVMSKVTGTEFKGSTRSQSPKGKQSRVTPIEIGKRTSAEDKERSTRKEVENEKAEITSEKKENKLIDDDGERRNGEIVSGVEQVDDNSAMTEQLAVKGEGVEEGEVPEEKESVKKNSSGGNDVHPAACGDSQQSLFSSASTTRSNSTATASTLPLKENDRRPPHITHNSAPRVHRRIPDHLEIQKVTEYLLQFAEEVTDNSRTFMEVYPGKPQPKDYTVYPGKMDHTSVLIIQAG